MFMLVLQFTYSISNDYDRLIEIEESFCKTLSDPSVVDGHDAGMQQMNIFVKTSRPVDDFESCKKILETQYAGVEFCSAYRKIESETYTIIWPDNLKIFTVT